MIRRRRRDGWQARYDRSLADENERLSQADITPRGCILELVGEVVGSLALLGIGALLLSAFRVRPLLTGFGVLATLLIVTEVLLMVRRRRDPTSTHWSAAKRVCISAVLLGAYAAVLYLSG